MMSVPDPPAPLEAAAPGPTEQRLRMEQYLRRRERRTAGRNDDRPPSRHKQGPPSRTERRAAVAGTPSSRKLGLPLSKPRTSAPLLDDPRHGLTDGSPKLGSRMPGHTRSRVAISRGRPQRGHETSAITKQRPSERAPRTG